VPYQGRDFEVPFELSGKTVHLVVDPHEGKVVGVEDAEGNALGLATPLDTIANAQRRRRRPDPNAGGSVVSSLVQDDSSLNGVELAYRQYHGQAAQEEN
jgi:hypothetical protein